MPGPGEKVGADRFLPTRRSLLSRLRNADDHESWRSFFETYWKLIYSFAIKCGCSDTEAEEVVQETIIAISKKMPEFQYNPAVCSFKGWLMHVTHCRVVDQIRKRDRRLVQQVSRSTSTTETSLLERIADPKGNELETIWKEEWEKNIVDAALERVKRKVNPQHYQIFHLHFIKKQTTESIADLLSISAAQVYLAKHRVGALVKKEIKVLEKKML